VPTEVAYGGESIRWGYEVPNSRRSSEPLACLNLLLEQPYADPQSVAEDEALRATPLRASTNFRASWSDSHGGARQTGGPVELSGATRLQQLTGHSVVTESSATSPPSRVLGPSPSVTRLRRSRQILEERHISALTVVADFLSKVRETTLRSLERSYETHWVLRTPVKWILTVPERWDDSAKERMAQATRQAGFGVRAMDFELVSESECAAAYALKAVSTRLAVGYRLSLVSQPVANPAPTVLPVWGRFRPM
jgi:hypothetical protein